MINYYPTHIRQIREEDCSKTPVRKIYEMLKANPTSDSLFRNNYVICSSSTFITLLGNTVPEFEAEEHIMHQIEMIVNVQSNRFINAFPLVMLIIKKEENEFNTGS